MTKGSKRRKKTILTVADAFAGAGGLSAGFAMARGPGGERFKVVYAVDRDKQAIATYRTNHFPNLSIEDRESIVLCDDVKNVDAERIRAAIAPRKRIDVLIGGPSCQGVSPAGLRNPADKRNQMLLAFVRLIKELRPRWFVMENVPGLTHANNRDLLAEILKLMEEIDGYKVAADVLLAADFGVPQFRHRLFIIGTNTGTPIRFPTPTHVVVNSSNKKANKRKKPYVTVSGAIRDLSQVEALELAYGVDPKFPNRVPNHWCRGMTSINRRRIESVREGRDWRDIPLKLLPERYFTTRSSDQKGSYGRLAWDWPAYTVTNASLNISAGPFTHPTQDRCLSVREVARIQTFPDSYIFQGSVEAQYRQVGNAVPPLLARAVAKIILKTHFGRRKAPQVGVSGRLTRKLIEQTLAEGRDLPTLTPRFPHPNVARPMQHAAQSHAERIAKGKMPAVWNRSPRPADPWPEDTKLLRALAKQPQNVRAAKRARAIIQFIDAKPRGQIVKLANVASKNVQRWINQYYAYGLDGWRAYQTGLDHLAPNDPRLSKAIRSQVAKARKLLTKRVDAAASKRLHMNAYLRRLIKRFSNYSTDSLRSEIEDKLGVNLGTVYVGDLLAIADAVLQQAGRIKKRPRRTHTGHHGARRTYETTVARLPTKHPRFPKSPSHTAHRTDIHSFR